MNSSSVTILGSIQVDCASISVELSNLDGVLLRQAHTRMHGDDALGWEAGFDHIAQFVKRLC